MASYQYEQLTPETFQQLSQSLLLRAFSGLQCFPVGQPDGGRDGIVRLFGSSPKTTGFVLFQVKFARRELNPADARNWLLKTLKDELPKVRKRVDDGAQQFVLVTNVAGTAHPQSGSIDTLQALLEEHIPIPAQAWWRDDLDRRLDDALDLKFSYPALLSGTDVLRLLIEKSPSEGLQRRRNAMTAFLSQQFEGDREVKFKQVDLKNDVFDLFTDVPVVPRFVPGRRLKVSEGLEAAFRRAASSASGEIDSLHLAHWFEIHSYGEPGLRSPYWSNEGWLGAASLLLDSDFQRIEPLVILEGAPGQGKSTIAQYICQIHRMRLLSDCVSESVDPVHSNSPLRLPFKVELRDFATWLSGGNPFGTANFGESSDEKPKTLEGFLSTLVRYESGGSDFNVSDLQATLHSSPVLIVLDGLDEVAEVNLRRRVAEEITSAIHRLQRIAGSLQVVVTTRPTPFMNSTVLPKSSFATYSLESLSKPLITEYSERWLQSKAIDKADAREVRKILDTKLGEPHLRDLARNPMQLAILLSLIHRRGVSLPDKRTALYRSYVSLFFDRESEKATVVKENRDLLIRIHGYLAWVLQSGAEVSLATPRARPYRTSMSGTISLRDLKELIRDFLEREGSDPDLVDKLFSGMVERVVAIVSRVEGLYEFDVQTLREYFAARHLYKTAPPSPTGDERRGTISDRWRALSRNYYWLNVARFYAGCYSEGELASLVDELRVLSEDEIFGHTSHPQLLTATLLGDWVFSQKPTVTFAALDLILEPRKLRLFLSSAGSGPHHSNEVIVRESNGLGRLMDACKKLVSPDRPVEEVSRILRNVVLPNSGPEDLLEWWIEELRSADETQAGRWCRYGEILRCWSVVDRDTVTDLLGREEVPSARVIAGLLHGSRTDILESHPDLFDAAVNAVLAGEWVRKSQGSSVLAALSDSVSSTVLRLSDFPYSAARGMSVLEYLRQYRDYEEVTTWPSHPTAKRCKRVVQAFENVAERPVEDWLTSIEPWSQVVQQGISEFGDRQRFVELANLVAGIPSKTEQCLDSPDLFDVNRPLVRRARYARLRAGSKKWWLKHLQSATNAHESRMALLLFATWAGARTIEELAEVLDELIVNLGVSEWYRLYSSLSTVYGIYSRRSWNKPLGVRVSALPPSLSARTAALLSERCTRAKVDDLYERYLTNYQGDDPIVHSVHADVLVRRAIKDEAEWPEALRCLASNYKLGTGGSRALAQHLRGNVTLPKTAARAIVDQPLEYPAALIRAAESICRQATAARIVPVGRVATDEGWFTEDSPAM